MTAGGILFMTVSWGVIIGLNLFCFHRLSRGRNRRLSNPSGRPRG